MSDVSKYKYLREINHRIWQNTTPPILVAAWTIKMSYTDFWEIEK